MRWKRAMTSALYGPAGFFVRNAPSAHFRTSVHASPLFAGAIATLLTRLDDALERPDPLDLVDVGAGRGELLPGVLGALPPDVRDRVHATAVEVAPRPDGLDPSITWTATPPDRITGLLVATEWLDNVPVDIVEVDEDGRVRYVCVDGTGSEWLDDAELSPDDAAWLARWWPLDTTVPGARAELGAPRDAAWAGAVRRIERGLALAVDYGHTADHRPLFGTLTGFRDGRETAPLPDGSTDITAAVALDAVAAAGPEGGSGTGLHVQHLVLRSLGVDGRRPALALASTDPAGYVRALARAGAAAELTDPAGLGGHHWLLHWV